MTGEEFLAGRKAVVYANGLSVFGLVFGVAMTLSVGKSPWTDWVAFAGFCGCLFIPFVNGYMQVRQEARRLATIATTRGDIYVRLAAQDETIARLRQYLDECGIHPSDDDASPP